MKCFAILYLPMQKTVKLREDLTLRDKNFVNKMYFKVKVSEYSRSVKTFAAIGEENFGVTDKISLKIIPALGIFMFC